MKKNMGTVDKAIRLIVAAILSSLYFTDIIQGKLGVTAIVFSVILLLTSFISFCPVYTLFGMNTCKTKTT
ncbi:YgaP family membrane protein [Ferruginibacter sp. SUN002]|uniref:YgaP family membrane protein n=1 Tax=Ferruginibacter sp. SUN002 TaxID=2937789 RepID=UPI003D36B571